MVQEAALAQRRHERISFPQGMHVAWYGGGGQEVSRVRTLGMGAEFTRLSLSDRTLPERVLMRLLL